MVAVRKVHDDTLMCATSAHSSGVGDNWAASYYSSYWSCRCCDRHENDSAVSLSDQTTNNESLLFHQLGRKIIYGQCFLLEIYKSMQIQNETQSVINMTVYRPSIACLWPIHSNNNTIQYSRRSRWRNNELSARTRSADQVGYEWHADYDFSLAAAECGSRGVHPPKVQDAKFPLLHPQNWVSGVSPPENFGHRIHYGRRWVLVHFQWFKSNFILGLFSVRTKKINVIGPSLHY